MKNLTKKRIATLLGLGICLTAFFGCQKETSEPGARSIDKETAGIAKAPYPLFRMDNGTGTKNFSVQSGCNGCYGLIQNTTPTDPVMHMTNQNSSALFVMGFTDPQCTNVTNCRLNKTTGSSTNWYYLVPNQGPALGVRKILKLAVKSNAPMLSPFTIPKFTYNVTENVWTTAQDASMYFSWSIVTAVPASTCCLPC